LLDLVYSEGRLSCIVLPVLDIEDPHVLLHLLLIYCEVEKVGAVHSKHGWVEIVAEETEKFGQVLAQSRHVVDPKLGQETRRHEHDAVAVETSTVGLVQIIPSQQLFDN